ncbi:tyrosine-type recombinase/integrase [Xanthobacter aminoxidans]|uniref:tyrosine-type recombinase/integrase n=1 Tax=Xanthobacter aminoxidans TaxID=186280 RepID=UPI002022F5F5|nr:tyrosine-type recombinase/integrase [Xanthobacter aminoxidans]MCL8385855.1 tyrosine-type recombinase/integrase [Xanthobacter aminoxidans]
MPRPLPPCLQRERTRHGAIIFYVRKKHGPRVRLRAEFGTPEFWEEYRRAMADETPASTAKTPKAGTIAWGFALYRRSSAWAGLSNSTRRARENILRQIVESSGEKMLTQISQATIIAGREKRAKAPHSANAFLKTLRTFFGWAAGEGGLVKVDPTIGVKLLKGPNDADGFHTWTEEEVRRFEEAWPVGTRERLALDLLLYTGLRRGDAARLGRQHVRDGVLTIRTEKTGEVVSLPILEPLARSIAATNTGDMTFLVTERGAPFVKESFGNWFKKACVKAKVPGSAHGLRKAGATRAAENGATERELMALFGWTSGKMATHYTRAASQKRLAQDAASLLLPKQTTNKSARTKRSGAGASAKKR